jgi:hypothetical protein
MLPQLAFLQGLRPPALIVWFFPPVETAGYNDGTTMSKKSVPRRRFQRPAFPYGPNRARTPNPLADPGAGDDRPRPTHSERESIVCPKREAHQAIYRHHAKNWPDASNSLTVSSAPKYPNTHRKSQRGERNIRGQNVGRRDTEEDMQNGINENKHPSRAEGEDPTKCPRELPNCFPLD